MTADSAQVLNDDGTGYLEIGVAAGALLRLPLSLLPGNMLAFGSELLVISTQPPSDPDDPDARTPPRELIRIRVERMTP